MNVSGSFTITLHVNPTDTPEKFASDLDKAIEGLKRMRKEMFKPVPVAVKRAWKGKKR
jgi:hypothetical protein